ncbi:MAG: ferredoxin-type protein NapF [bacterium]|nr:ferredoxin-type protein NapF [bacterium]
MELERRNFLRGRFKPSPGVIRPPYAVVEREFFSLCKKCSDCASSCEEKVIKLDETGYPEMSFGLGECTFCRDCTKACETGALDEENARPWNVKAEIGDNCLSVNAVFCRTCGDNCDEEAIVFKLMLKGRSKPIVDDELCTGCGACVMVCPNKSIKMTDGQKVKGREDLNV